MQKTELEKPSLSSLLHVHGLYDDFVRVLEIAERNESAPEIDKVRAALLSKDTDNG